MAKRQVEVDITPTLEDLPQLLMDAATLLEAAAQNENTTELIKTNVRLQESLREAKKELTEGLVEMQTLREGFDKAKIRIKDLEERLTLQNLQRDPFVEGPTKPIGNGTGSKRKLSPRMATSDAQIEEAIRNKGDLSLKALRACLGVGQQRMLMVQRRIAMAQYTE